MTSRHLGPIFICVAALLNVSRIAVCSQIAIAAEQDWAGGTCVGVNPHRIYGQLELTSAAGIPGDSFDQNFIKGIWQEDPSATFSKPNSVGWTIGAGNGSNGLTTAYRPVAGNKVIAYATIGPLSIGDIGCLFVGSSPWSQSYYGVAVSRTTSGLLAEIVSGTAITKTRAIGVQIASLDVCLSFTAQDGAPIFAFYRMTGTAKWQPLTTTPSVWAQVDSSTVSLSQVNYALGLGLPINPNLQGTATYSNFQVLPYTSTGTWTSAPIDLGGIPSRAPLLSWLADVSATCTVQIQSRQSADGQAWGAWSDPYAGPHSLSLVGTPQRYVQILATLASSDPSGNSTPVLHSISLDMQDFGRAELVKKADVKILPNPVKGNSAVVQWLLSSPAKKVRLEFSGTGRPQMLVVDGPGSVGLNSYTLDCSQMANDVYFVRVRALGLDGHETDVVKKILVSR